MTGIRHLRVAEEIGETKEEAVLGRFDQARGNGASERMALKVAAWAWLEWNPGGNILSATREARRFLIRNGRQLSIN